MAAAIPIISALISAAGSAGAAYLSNQSKKESKTQKTQRHLMDELLRSLDGTGKYGALFQGDEEAFNKSFKEPALAKFRNQIVPQIQQSYIASGQQRGTGMEDTLTRAGVDLDQLINEQFMNFQQGAQNRQLGAINSILGQSAGSQRMSGLDSATQGVAGYLSSEGFGSDLSNILDQFKPKPEIYSQSIEDTFLPQRKGFETENPVYNPYTGVQR